MKTDGGYVSIEQAEELERRHKEKMEEVDRRVEKTTAKLKELGYKFEVESGLAEFVVSVGAVKHHIMKIDPFPLAKKNEDSKLLTDNPKIEDVIKAVIINSGGSIYDTIHSPEFKGIQKNVNKDIKSGS